RPSFASCDCKASLFAQPGPNGTEPGLRDFDLGRAKPILLGERRVRCSLLTQQAFRLEKHFEVDHGFHRTPLVPGCLEALQYVSPGVARSGRFLNQHNSIIRAPLAFARRFLKVWRLTLCLVTFTFAMLFPVLVHA